MRPRLTRPGIVIVTRTCKSTYVSTSHFFVRVKTILKSRKTSSGALVVALLVRLISLARCFSAASGGPMRPLARKGVLREAQVREKQHGRKKRSENGALTPQSKFQEQAT